MKTCPHCAETDLQDAAIVCKHCGRDMPLSRSDYRLAVTALVLIGAFLVYGVASTAMQWPNADARIVTSDR
jgi:uncharacterized protein (DUF983 family)